MPLRVFPLAGGAQHYSDDWHPVADEQGRQHLGNDLFGPEGLPLLAVDNGSVRYGHDGFGGNVVLLTGDDGTLYYYAHQRAFEGNNRTVRAGEVIGYLGTTGNAQGTPPHVHFEVHPQGSMGTPAVDPFPFLQRSSIQNAPSGFASRSTALRLLLLGLLVGGGALALYAYQNPAGARRLTRGIL